MNIDNFKRQHVEILAGIREMRELAHAGIATHAVDISRELTDLSRIVIQHLAIEDRILYPSLEKSGDPEIARLGARYQRDMEGIASAFIQFSRRWADVSRLEAAPDDFRIEANTVLRRVHERMQRENSEFYPAIETLSV